MPNYSAEYGDLQRQARLEEAGGLAKERAILLLWFMRAIFGLDDLDAYEYVCDNDHDGGIDGLYLEEASGDEDFETLVIFQSKYPMTPNEVGRTALEGLIAAADKFRTAQGLRAFLAGTVDAQLRQLITRFDLVNKLDADAVGQGRLKIRLVFVTAGWLGPEAQALITATNAAADGANYLTAYDITTLGPVAKSAVGSAVPQRQVSLPLPAAERVVFGTSPQRILIGAATASDIVQWPGVKDRSLFELNVRRELRSNPVRRQLDAAIARQHDHKDFLAYHNGLTIICTSFNLTPTTIEIIGPSIVNGAQSVIAFDAALTLGLLSPDLRIAVKLVETSSRPALAEQVSRRSNTQNPVNARNLVANTPRQQRLVAEFDTDYPAYYYETKPDTQPAPVAAGRTVIQNDDAAQWLCAVMLQEPWLAVKRNSLFDPDNHPRVFHETISAADVLFVYMISQAVDSERSRFPDAYRRSWRLTRLIAIYLVGQLLRAADPGTNERIAIDDRVLAVSDLTRLEATLQPLVRHVAAALKVRHDRRAREGREDDFKV
jgi:hypothetical protein